MTALTHTDKKLSFHHSIVNAFITIFPMFTSLYSMLRYFILSFQSLIQRQQVQIQSFTQKNNSEEIQRLREQNQKLMSFFNSQLGASIPVSEDKVSNSENIEKYVGLLLDHSLNLYGF